MSWATIALLPFLPLIAMVVVLTLSVIPGLSELLWLPLALVGIASPPTVIAMSLWSVVQSMREAQRTADWRALLLPLPSLAMAAMAALVLGDALLQMVR